MSNVGVAGDLDTGVVGGVVLTCAFFGDVFHIVFENQVSLSFLEPLETSIVVSSGASVTAGIAVRRSATVVSHVLDTVDEFPFRKREELAGLDCVGSLKHSHSCEGPAGPTRGLVLDGRDTSVLSPIPGIGDHITFNRSVDSRSFHFLQSKHAIEFLVGPIGEFVVTRFEAIARIRFVPLSNGLIRLLEVLKAHLELFNCIVRLSMRTAVLHERAHARISYCDGSQKDG